MVKKSKHDTILNVLIYIVFTVVLIGVAYPLIWMFYTSFKMQSEIFINPFSLPKSLNFENYVKAWTQGNFGRYFVNSVTVVVPTLLGLVVIATLAAYSFAILRFKGKNFLFVLFLVGLMIPFQAILITNFKIVAALGLIDTFLALIFTYFGWCPVGILIIRAFFSQVPKEIIECARIDGCSEVSIYWKIAFPLAKPAVVTILVFYFVWVWNDFAFPLIYIRDNIKNTIPLGLMAFQGRFNVNWGGLCAALSMAVFPPLVGYIVFQSAFVKGLTAGAVKG